MERTWLAMALAVCGSTWMVRNAWVRIRGDEVVRVTGSARREVKADAIVWTAHLTVRADGLEDGYQRLETALGKISEWLRARQVNDLSVAALRLQHAGEHQARSHGPGGEERARAGRAHGRRGGQQAGTSAAQFSTSPP
jgi:hypothetical protein